MGAVYLAEHPAIGRRVAVKVLHPNYTRDPQLLGRFLNEARAANAIRHPNIIEILDSGVIADGTPFLVMELLEGESLGTRLRREGALPIATALELAYQTASALGAAHAKGIVHRDLKPDNLFLVADPHEPDRQRIKVLDFGIAKLQQGSSSDSVKTRTGTLMGTPIYMSPEQCRGTKAIDHRSDIYSLAVILYEMLVGHPPFVSEGFGELVNMHLNMAPQPMRDERPEIPTAVDALVLKMLAKNPDERYRDMGEVQTALKGSGGFQVRSSPRLANPVGATTAPFGAKVHDTTFTTGVGERVGGTTSRMGGGSKAALAIGAAALAGAAYFVFGSGKTEAPARPVAADVAKSAPAAAPATTSPTAAPKPAVAAMPLAPKPITLRVVSEPAGAKVIDDDGSALGLTPLVLTRPRGGALKLRVEKDGYGPGTRTVSLESDQSVQLTLERQKPKHVAHKHHDAVEEPAKL
jgi:serine/threonine-protein kinase